MKTNVIMPILALGLSTGAVFASQSEEKRADIMGYRQVIENGELTCVESKECTDIDTGVVCTWSDGSILRHKVAENVCTQPLFEKIN